LDHKQDGDNQRGQVDTAPAAGCQLQDDVADKAKGQAVGNRVGEGHGEGSQGSRYGLGHVVPFHLSNFAHHQARHVQQGGGGGVTGNGRGQRREKQGQQKQHANGQGGQTGTPTGLHTRGAFHVGGGAAGAQHGTGHNGGTVSQQGAAQAVGFGFFDQAGTLGNPDDGASGIKHFNQHQHQNHVNKAGVQGTHDVQLHEGRHQRGGSGDHTTKFAVTGQHGQNGHGQNTDQD